MKQREIWHINQASMYVSEAVTSEIAMFTRSNNFYNFNIFPMIKLPNAKNRKKNSVKLQPLEFLSPLFFRCMAIRALNIRCT